MPRPVSFEPYDPNNPFGPGDLTLDNGVVQYLDDPDLAAQFMKLPPNPPAPPPPPAGGFDLDTYEPGGITQQEAKATVAGASEPSGFGKALGTIGKLATDPEARKDADAASMGFKRPSPDEMMKSAVAAASDPKFNMAEDSKAQADEEDQARAPSATLEDQANPELPPGMSIGLDGTVTQGKPDDGLRLTQRTGRLDPAVAAQQSGDMRAQQASLESATLQARNDEARIQREAAATRKGQLEAEIESLKKAEAEEKAKRERLLAEQHDVEETKIGEGLIAAQGFGAFFSVLGAAFLGATGSDAGLRMIDRAVNQHVRTQIDKRDSKLRGLADRLGSNEQAIAAAKADLYRRGIDHAEQLQQLTRASQFEANTPAVLEGMKAKHLEYNQAFERESLGKPVEELPPMPKPVDPGRVLKYGETAMANQQSQADANRALQAVGGIWDPQTKRITNRAEILKNGIPGVGAFDTFMKDLGRLPIVGALPQAADTALTSKEGLGVRNALQALVTAQARADNPGRAPTDADMTAARDNLGLNTEEGVLSAIERILGNQGNLRAGAISAHGPDAAGVFEGRQDAQGVSRPTGASPGASRPATLEDLGPQSANDGGPIGEVAGEVQAQAGQVLPPGAVRILAAQAAHETDDGKSAPNRNYFGHKATGGRASANLETTEGAGKNAKRVRQNFVKYETVADSVKDHLSLLQRKYPQAWEALLAEDESAFVEALAQGGYFTGDQTAYLKGVQRRL